MKPYKYENLVSDLRGLVLSGAVAPGEKLPSLRRLSRERGLSIATVMRAYVALECDNVVAAAPRSGFVALPQAGALEVPGMLAPAAKKPFFTPARFISDLMAAAPGNLRVFSGGCPAPALLPNKAMARAAQAALRADPELNSRYGNPCGSVKLRQVIAARLAAAGLRCGADGVVITSGASEAISLAVLAVTKPGDTVAVETPGYVGFYTILQQHGRKMLPVPSDAVHGFDVSYFEKVAARHRVKAVLLAPNFSNPAGAVMPDDEKRRLLDLCARRDIAVVEDDVYGDLYFSPARPAALTRFASKGRVLYVSSFSKTLGPGLRVGYIVPGECFAAVMSAKTATTLSAPVLTQEIVARLAANGGYDRHLRSLRALYARNISVVYSLVSEHFPSGTKVTRPAGSFYLWVELPAHADAGVIAKRALARGLLIVPGSVFSPDGEYRNYFRLGVARKFSHAEAEAAVLELSALCGG